MTKKVKELQAQINLAEIEIENLKNTLWDRYTQIARLQIRLGEEIEKRSRAENKVKDLEYKLECIIEQQKQTYNKID